MVGNNFEILSFAALTRFFCGMTKIPALYSEFLVLIQRSNPTSNKIYIKSPCRSQNTHVNLQFIRPIMNKRKKHFYRLVRSFTTRYVTC